MAENPNPSSAPAFSHAEWQAVAIALHDAVRGRDPVPAPGDRPGRWHGVALAHPGEAAAAADRSAARCGAAVRGRGPCHGSHARDLVPKSLGLGYTPAQVEALRRIAA